jgi:guanosine-3',5'-bis(diphosphate) 3'-pyrophosphohydrolase
MADTLKSTCRPLLEAIAFAARAHRGQFRKDGKTPYHSHVFRACLIVRHVFGIEDSEVLAAAVLHDTVEDSTTDYDDLCEAFGKDVADWVAALSKDSRLPEEEREASYCETLARAPWQVKVCKLADIFDNVTDCGSVAPEQRGRVFRKARRYLDAVRQDLPEQARQPWEIVARLVAELEGAHQGQAPPDEPEA